MKTARRGFLFRAEVRCAQSATVTKRAVYLSAMPCLEADKQLAGQANEVSESSSALRRSLSASQGVSRWLVCRSYDCRACVFGRRMQFPHQRSCLEVCELGQHPSLPDTCIRLTSDFDHWLSFKMNEMKPLSWKGFTLIALLVVIAIVVAPLLQAVQQPRPSTTDRVC